MIGLLGSGPAAHAEEPGHSHPAECQRYPVISASKAERRLSESHHIEGVSVAGRLHLKQPGPVDIVDSCVDSLEIQGSNVGQVHLRNVFVENAVHIGPRTAMGAFVVEDGRLGLGAYVDDAAIGTLRLDTVTLVDGGLSFRQVNVGDMTIDGVWHDRVEQGDLNGICEDTRGISLSSVTVKGNLRISDTHVADLCGSLTVLGDLTLVESPIPLVGLQGLQVRGRTAIAFQSFPRLLSLSRADFGQLASLVLQGTASDSSKLDLSWMVGNFGRLPPSDVVIPSLRRGISESGILRTTLLQLSAQYQRAGMTLDALEARRVVAELDVEQAPLLAPKITALLRWIGGGKGAAERVLSAWFGTVVCAIVAQFLVQFWCAAFPKSAIPEDKAGADFQTLVTLARGRYPWRARFGFALVAALNSVTPVSWEHHLRLLWPALFVHVVTRVVIWALLLIFAGSLAGYF